MRVYSNHGVMCCFVVICHCGNVIPSTMISHTRDVADGSVIDVLVVTMVIKLLMASDIMIRLSSTVSNAHMVSSGAGDVGSGGAGDDDEMSWSHVDDTGSYDGDMGLKNDGSGDNGNDGGGGGDRAGDVICGGGGPDTREDSDGGDSGGDDGVGVVIGDLMHGGGGPDGDEDSVSEGVVIGDVMHSGGGPDGEEDSSGDGGDSDDGGGDAVVGCDCGCGGNVIENRPFYLIPAVSHLLSECT